MLSMSSDYLNGSSDDRVNELHKYKMKTNKRDDDDDEVSSDEGYHGLSPPPPPDDMLDLFTDGEGSERRFCYSPVEANPKIEYNDVGEEISVEITIIPNQEIGLTILTAQSFSPSWPVILDIKRETAAYSTNPSIKIGDQIKEINGVTTVQLSNTQILSLFAKASDTLHLLLQRGVEPTKREFDWFKSPFLSVNCKSFEVIPVTIYHTSRPNRNEMIRSEGDLYGRISDFSTFIDTKDSQTSFEQKRFKEIEVSETKDGHFKHFRSLSVSSAGKNILLARERQRRKTVQETKSTCETYRDNDYSSLDITSPSTKHRRSGSGVNSSGKNSRSIFSEVEMRRARCDSRTSSGIGGSDVMSRKSSESSLLSSSSSSSTISSLAGSSTNVGQLTGVAQGFYISNHTVNQNAERIESTEHNSHDKTVDHGHNLSRTPVNKLRDSFRRKMKMKNSNSIPEQLSENTLSVTVWVPDRRKLGIKLGGGSVSPYGDSNICVLEVKKTGTAHKLLRAGDELLEVDGRLTIGVDVYQVNELFKRLEGNYVELKIFRPSLK